MEEHVAFDMATERLVNSKRDLLASEPVIKFSHDYMKLPENWEGTHAHLLIVGEVDLEHQTPFMLNYDTQFRGETGNYDLPKKGRFILLGFIHESGAFFTTLRRCTPEKEKYYQGLWGEWFEMVRI